VKLKTFNLDLVRKLIRKKKFAKYLINNCYPVAIDGTQKMIRDGLWDEECLERTYNKGKCNEHTQYYVYVMQANLAFAGGMSIPLMSEFLSYTEGDTGNGKQDCETKAFYRLAKRLKKAFPALRIILLMDGLYAQGPVMEACGKNKWQYMIVAKDGSIPSLMKEFESLAELEPANRHFRTWGNRKQRFKWINEIEYCYGANDKL
jgi:hypothetical protein